MFKVQAVAVRSGASESTIRFCFGRSCQREAARSCELRGFLLAFNREEIIRFTDRASRG